LAGLAGKRSWTSSFSLIASGCAAALPGVFCRIVDVWRGQKWCASLLWIGSTAAVIYLAANVIGGEVLAARPAGGDSKA
jgi:predicted acyltransferase